MKTSPVPSHKITKLKDLDELEQWMCRAIRTPMDSQDSVTPDPVYYLKPGSQLSAKERLAIYVDDYWSRCIHTLAEDFASLERLWGHEKFHSFVADYLTAHPSRSYTLRNLGDKLLDFVQANYRGGDKALVSDIIRYEWAKIEGFDHPVLAPFDASKLSKKQRENLSSLSFVFQPHVTLLKLMHPVYDLDEKIHAVARKECYTVVYRRDLQVYHKEIERPFYRMLEELRRGASLSEACDKILPLLSQAEINKLEKKAQMWFQSCVANQWFCAPDRNTYPVIASRRRSNLEEQPDCFAPGSQ